MALRLKKDIKKASYYVWFLGAQESRGLRGEEFALPAIRVLEERARDLEPFKVTLQVSHKGLKIIQNVTAKGKQQTIKHFIPHGSITSAVVQADVVACVLLLYNPVTGCPVHVHAYRCDSDHTAEMLYTHLQALIDRPENQKKFADIERKLQMRGALPSTKKPPDSSLGSEVSRESDSGSNEERCVANLYDSLAAELKQKLSTGKKGLGKSPILLPPRDYDTVHRQKGNLSNIDTRRCLNQNIVGVNARRKLESSGGSSGIGSDLAPSPERNEYARQHDNHSTSEEEWAESTAYMMHEAFEASPRRAVSPRRASPPAARRALSPHSYDRTPAYDDYNDQYRDQLAPFREQSSFDRRFRHESLERVSKDKPDKFNDDAPSYRRRYITDSKPSNRSIDRVEDRRFGKLQRGASEGSLKVAEIASPKDRFNVAKEKFMNLERERFNRELEQHMAIRRSMLERNSRSTSSPEEEIRDERPERHRELNSRREPERTHRELDRAHREPDRRKDPERVRDVDRDLAHREIERLPRVSRKRDDNMKRYEYGAEEYLNRIEPKPQREEFDRYRDRRELDRRIDEDEVFEPVIEERRRDWTDRQRAFSRSRLLEDHRQSYAEGDRDRYYDRDYPNFRDLAERQPAKFRHSYAEPIPRGRLGTVRPY
ncbi:capping protein inhibiting regulator of actin dynamics isoform X1 [Plodia interpunctella]|uniref:capping protein inhibiting regulator of actin dynamics isoform X1 n=1 Tax=Plodia interpunctella TaxID=58824 RepID=UPI002368DE49|nr:capping protein inhibiting regulator of actin dynamics isoform X1 [Plodia interpunctella]XP_053617131.1 capping protein inhibiting regulator of actin dynamics isoform X1 [Plodia interpunctella]